MQQRAKEYLARRNRRTITSQIRGVSSFSLSSWIYFSIRNDTATFSTRISHRRIARRRDTARPSDETFRTSSFLLAPSQLPVPSSFWLGLLLHFPRPPRRSGMKFRRPFSDSRRFREISRRLARFILPVIVERGRAHLPENFEETSVEKVPSTRPPRLIDTILLACRDLSAPPLYT